jgi:tetratricopeptide (TPR) repeat protein
MFTTFMFAAMLVVDPAVAIPDNFDELLTRLKEAETKQDAAVVKKLATETCAAARKIASAPAPATEEEKQIWNTNVERARSVEVYTEYALFNAAMRGTPAVTVDLLSTLEQQNPKSKYLGQAYGQYLVALNATGAGAKIPSIAESAVSRFPDNEDLLLVLANSAMSKKQTDRALKYSERLIVVLSKHPAPQGISAADWERKRTTGLARGHWIAGIMHCDKTQYYEADKDLRIALPLVSADESMKASALFYLGIANYQLGSAMRSRGQVLEAARFSEQAAAVKGPLSQEAWRNAQIMKTEAAKLR